MSIKIKLNLVLQEIAGNRETIEVNGQTIKECLDDLVRILPGAEKAIFDASGSLIPLVLVNNEVLPPGELSRNVTPNDQLWLVSVLEGG